MDSRSGDGPSRGMLIAALIVAVGAVVGVLAVAAVLQRPDGPAPVSVAALPAPRSDGPECRALVDALPERLGDYRRAELVEPAPVGTAAWQLPDGGEAVILRCGLSRPGEFVVGAPLQMVDAVSWLRVSDAGSADGRTTWFAVDRPVYIALTLPAGSGPAPIQALSTVITQSLPARPIDPAPAR